MSEGGGAMASGAGATGRGGGVTVRTVLDTGAGRDGLVRRLVEVRPGYRFEAAAGPGGDLWYVLGGQGLLVSGAEPATALRPDTALWLPPGTRCSLSAGAEGPLRLDNVSLPSGTAAPDHAAPDHAAPDHAAPDHAAPDHAAPNDAAPDGPGAPDRAAPQAAWAPDAAGPPQVSLLEECAVEVTGDRRFRVLFGPGRGCEAATQFVGEIPPGRAPLHSHTYDEVVLVLEGEGVLHAGPGGHPLAPGSCIHLPPGQQHCLENTGQGMLRVLGIFHPGGSPAAKTVAS